MEKRYPCKNNLRYVDVNIVNKYDMLWPYNLSAVFGHSMLWWIPFY